MKAWWMCLLIFGQPAVAQSPLEPMAWLVKRCWAGELPDGTRDQHCYSWMYDGQFIRDQHVVTGGETEYRGETVYAWDAENQRVVYWYWASSGSYSTGHLVVEDGMLVFPESHRMDDGSVLEMRNEVRRLDPHRYRNRTLKRSADGDWEEMWNVTYVDVATTLSQAPAIAVPDGERWYLAFNSLRDGNYEVYRVALDGTGATNVSAHPGTDWVYAGTEANEGYPDWSPDGRYLAFHSDRDANYEIYVMEADGTAPRRISVHPGEDQAPVWWRLVADGPADTPR